MDRDDVAFPDANEIAPHAIAFARMMFAHAEFERGIRSLVDAINTKEPGFGERRACRTTTGVSTANWQFLNEVRRELGG
jgi:hypothetical protein